MEMTDSFKSMFSGSTDTTNKTTTPSPVTTEEDLRLPIGALAHISKLEKEHGLDSGILLAIAQQESGGTKDRANARSKVGAQGWFQFMPDTAKQYKVNPSDFFSASSGAAKYLSDLNKKFDEDQDKVLAAYNWGQGNVSRKGLEKMPSETSNYLTKVKENISKFGGMFDAKPRHIRSEPDPGFPMNMFTPDFKKLLGLEEASVMDKYKPPENIPSEVKNEPSLSPGLEVANVGPISINATDFLPIEKGIAMAGIIGKYTGKKVIKMAEALEDFNVPMKDIMARLGIYRGPVDNKWRFVLDDKKAQIITSEFPKNPYSPNVMGLSFLQDKPLSSVLSHPDLFKKYPELKEVKVTGALGQYKGGGYNPETNTIYLGADTSEKELTSTLLHEIQHVIQTKQGLTFGGNPEQFLPDPLQFEGAYTKITNDITMLQEKLRSQYKDFNPYMREQPKEITASKEWKYLKKLKELRTSASEIQSSIYDKYKHIAGEAEARAVSSQFKNQFLLDESKKIKSDFPLDFYDVEVDKLTKTKYSK